MNKDYPKYKYNNIFFLLKFVKMKGHNSACSDLLALSLLQDK